MATPFFTEEGIQFFNERLKSNRQYTKGDPQDEADGKRIKAEVFAPTNEWANAVTKELPEYAVDPDTHFLIGGGKFKKYSWARLYLKELGDKKIYFTLGVSGEDAVLVYKIDLKRNKLPEDVKNRLDAAIKAAGPGIAWNEFDPANEPNADWPRLVEITVDFIKRHEALFRQLHELLPTGTNTDDTVIKPFDERFPNPNIILYGPPGTGKTRETLALAYEILTGTPPPTYSDAQKRFQEEQDKQTQPEGSQLEFVTFHQSFSYEDFVQGIKPHTSGTGQLIFKQHNGIFYRIAQRARDEFNHQAHPGRPARVPFDQVFTLLTEPLVERREEVEMPMNKAGYAFHLIDLDEDYLRFRRHEKGTEGSLSLETLRALYEGTIGYKQGGLQLYYQYVVQRLEQLAAESPELASAPDAIDEATTPRNYVLIIDEINRANISKVFGELITLLEKDKRLGGENPLAVTLPSGETRFTVPKNLYIIGTMNTADKSIALLDIALRRRFEFRPLYPLYKLNGQPIPHADLLERLNAAITEAKSRDFQIGHAYFMTGETLGQILNGKVIPLLYEYFLNDEKKIAAILAKAQIPVKPHAETGLLHYPETVPTA
jgi:AAA domain (dynein-related subfamily)